MTVKCPNCGRRAVLTRPGKRKNCRGCGTDLRGAKPVKLKTVTIPSGRPVKPDKTQDTTNQAT